MVINVGALKSGDLHLVERDIRAVTSACRESNVLSKVIIETALLTEDEKVTACTLAKAAAADFVKTSTGFGPGGATAADVALMRRVVGEDMGIKASGGVRTLEGVKAMVAAGATRIGASAGVRIVQQSRGQQPAGGCKGVLAMARVMWQTRCLLTSVAIALLGAAVERRSRRRRNWRRPERCAPSFWAATRFRDESIRRRVKPAGTVPDLARELAKQARGAGRDRVGAQRRWRDWGVAGRDGRHRLPRLRRDACARSRFRRRVHRHGEQLSGQSDVADPCEPGRRSRRDHRRRGEGSDAGTLRQRDDEARRASACSTSCLRRPTSTRS